MKFNHDNWIIWLYVAVLSAVLLIGSAFYANAAGELYNQPQADYIIYFGRWFEVPPSLSETYWHSFRATGSGKLGSSEFVFFNHANPTTITDAYIKIALSEQDSNCTVKRFPTTEFASSTPKTFSSLVGGSTTTEAFYWGENAPTLSSGTCYQVIGHSSGSTANGLKPAEYYNLAVDGAVNNIGGTSAPQPNVKIRAVLTSVSSEINIVFPQGETYPVNYFNAVATTTNIEGEPLAIQWKFIDTDTPSSYPIKYTFYSTTEDSSYVAPFVVPTGSSTSTTSITLPNGNYDVEAVLVKKFSGVQLLIVGYATSTVQISVPESDVISLIGGTIPIGANKWPSRLFATTTPEFVTLLSPVDCSAYDSSGWFSTTTLSGIECAMKSGVVNIINKILSFGNETIITMKLKFLDTVEYVKTVFPMNIFIAINTAIDNAAVPIVGSYGISLSGSGLFGGRTMEILPSNMATLFDTNFGFTFGIKKFFSYAIIAMLTMELLVVLAKIISRFHHSSGKEDNEK